MKETIYTLERLVKAEHPVWITLIIGTCVMGLALILSPTSGAKLLDILFMKKKKGIINLDKKHFIHHPVYDYFSYILLRLRNLDFGDTGKTNAIKDMLYIKFTVYHKKIKEFISQGVSISDKFEFKKLVHSTILHVEQDIIKEWEKLNISMLDELIKDYNHWHSHSSSFAGMAICNITNSDIYDHNLERMQEILCIMEAKFRVSMHDIEKGFTEANGKYKALKYKSIYF